jgi:cytochrome c554/c'-like protein
MVRTSTRAFSGKRLIGVLLASILGLLLLPSLALVFAEDGGGEEAKFLGDKKCFFCHKDMKEAFPASIHGPLMAAEESTACESCHGSGREHVGSMGDLESIVRFGELSPKESATRCLSCHDQSATGGHVKGFLESKWLAEGKTCTSCHEAHGRALGRQRRKLQRK